MLAHLPGVDFKIGYVRHERASGDEERLFLKTTKEVVSEMIEWFNGWIKASRKVATRFGRLPGFYIGLVRLTWLWHTNI